MDRQLRDLIDQLLRARRPDRFVVSGDPEANETLDPDDIADIGWLDDVATEIEDEIPDAAVRHLYARALVGQREGQLCRRVNDQFRGYHRTTQWPLSTDPDWIGLCENDPISVVTRKHQPGERPKVLVEHVALRACTADDLRRFAAEERRRASRDHAAREEACSGAETIADEMDELGFVTWHDWAVSQGDDD